MTCSDSGMTAGPTTFADGASATQGEVVSTSKKTAPFSLTACKTSERVSPLTADTLWTLEQAFRTIGQVPSLIRILGQETRRRGHSSQACSDHKSARQVQDEFRASLRRCGPDPSYKY